MHFILIVVALFFIICQAFSQTLYRAKTLTFPNQLSGNHDAAARDYVELLPGFEMDGTTGTGEFYINEDLIFSTDYINPVDPVTRTLDLTLPVGTIPALTEVSLTGAATYNIPIRVPPGTHGLQPNLSIIYNGQAGNGLLGMGWNLAGLSLISRTGQNFYHEGKVKGITFSSDDRFALDGSRLICVSGTYGSSNSEYRTEIETFTKVVANGNANNGPVWFSAETKDGLIIEFGKILRILVLRHRVLL